MSNVNIGDTNHLQNVIFADPSSNQCLLLLIFNNQFSVHRETHSREACPCDNSNVISTTDHRPRCWTINGQRKVSRQSFSKLKFSNSLLPAVYIKSANYCMILSQTVSFTKLASTQADNKRFITVLQRPGVAAMLWGSKHDSVRATGYLRGGFWTSFLHTAISTDYASGLNPSMSLSLTFFFLTVPKLNDQY